MEHILIDGTLIALWVIVVLGLVGLVLYGVVRFMAAWNSDI